MDTEQIRYQEAFRARILPLHQQDVEVMMRRGPGSIGNVVGGLRRHCFGLLAAVREHTTMDFFCITSAQPQPGLLLRLQFGEPDFYDHLFDFATACGQAYPFLHAYDAYSAFILQLRQHLDVHGYQTIGSSDLEPGKSWGTVMPFEFMPGIDKATFYRDLLCSGDIKLDGRTRYVYLMLDLCTDHFKIGVSRQPRHRERTPKARPHEVALLNVWDCDPRIGRRLHKRFAAERVRQPHSRSAWFSLCTGDLLNLNADIAAMEIELASKPRPRRKTGA